MGKIVFANTRPETIAKMDEICSRKGFSKQIFESLVAGCNHGEIGALIAKKWNFPQVIVDVLRYHHNPESAPEESRQLAKIIYLADMMTHYEDGRVDYQQIDPEILSSLDITSEEQFQTISERLFSSFKR